MPEVEQVGATAMGAAGAAMAEEAVVVGEMEALDDTMEDMHLLLSLKGLFTRMVKSLKRLHRKFMLITGSRRRPYPDSDCGIPIRQE